MINRSVDLLEQGMQQLTFRQFSEAFDAAVTGAERPAFVTEGPIWDKIKAAAGAKTNRELQPAELEKLHALSVKGNLAARKDLDAYLKAKEKEGALTGRLARIAAAHKAHADNMEKNFQMARAGAEADDRGSSRAYDRETGTVKKREVRWDPETKRWVHAWAEIGKHS